MRSATQATWPTSSAVVEYHELCLFALHMSVDSFMTGTGPTSMPLPNRRPDPRSTEHNEAHSPQQRRLTRAPYPLRPPPLLPHPPLGLHLLLFQPPPLQPRRRALKIPLYLLPLPVKLTRRNQGRTILAIQQSQPLARAQSSGRQRPQKVRSLVVGLGAAITSRSGLGLGLAAVFRAPCACIGRIGWRRRHRDIDIDIHAFIAGKTGSVSEIRMRGAVPNHRAVV